MLTKQNSQLREALKGAQVAKSDAQRLKDEAAVLTKQNKHLVDEAQNNTEDDLRSKQIENQNKNALNAGVQLDAEEMKKRMKEAQEMMKQNANNHEE